MDKNSYIPIACDYVDYIEILAIRRTPVTIAYLERGEEILVEDDRIITWETKSKEEFLITKSGLKIRMDFIISINGQKPGDQCSI